MIELRREKKSEKDVQHLMSIHYSHPKGFVGRQLIYKIFDDDKSMQSPFGKWIDAYVAVVFDGDKYYYYWTGVDDAGWRIDLKKQVNKLTTQVNVKAKDNGVTVSIPQVIGDNTRFYAVLAVENLPEVNYELEFEDVELRATGKNGKKYDGFSKLFC